MPPSQAPITAPTVVEALIHAFYQDQTTDRLAAILSVLGNAMATVPVSVLASDAQLRAFAARSAVLESIPPDDAGLRVHPAVLQYPSGLRLYPTFTRAELISPEYASRTASLVQPFSLCAEDVLNTLSRYDALVLNPFSESVVLRPNLLSLLCGSAAPSEFGREPPPEEDLLS